jgi:transposase InsO family protein
MLWKGCDKDIKRFTQECAICQKTRLRQPEVLPTLAVTSTWKAFKRIAIDHLTVHEDKFGNCNIIVCVDTFTRFVELFPAKDYKDESVALCLINLAGRYGLVQEIQTDKGGAFTSDVVRRLMTLLGNEPRTTLPYRPQANGAVERVNQEVLRHLRALVMGLRCKQEWSAVLPLVQRIINSKPSESTGVAPVRLIYGNQVSIDQGLLGFDFTPLTVPVSIENRVEDLNRTLQELREAAVKYQTAVIEERLSRSPENPTKYSLRDKVLVSYPDRAPDKLTPRWRGPMEIVGTKGENIYSCRSLLDNKVEDLFVDRLLPYRSDPNMSDIAAALTDRDEYLVDQILSYWWYEKGKRNNVTNLRFKVNWIGYDPSVTNTLEWRDAKRLIQMPDFIRAHKELHKFEDKVPKGTDVPEV